MVSRNRFIGSIGYAKSRYSAVPKDMSTTLPAGAWVKEALAALDGKGGGKPTSAQGMGPKKEAIPDAIKLAEEMASMKLG